MSNGLYDSAFDTVRSMWIRSVMFVTQPIFQRLLPDPYTKAGNVRVEAKPAHESRITMTEIISPAQCNMKVLKSEHDIIIVVLNFFNDD
jgi:hypothetical protein